MSNKVFNKRSSGSLCIKNYNFNSAAAFKSLECYSNLVELMVMCMVTVTLLCQLRSLSPDSSSAKLDQLPSFRFYKKRVMLSHPGHGLAITLAASLPEAIANLADNPTELEEWLHAALDSYIGNEKFIERCSENNVIDFVCGHMSRILGYLNSCPASSLQSFNLDTSVIDWSISDVIERMGLPEGTSISVEHIIKRLRDECFEVPQYPITFAESPFLGPAAVKGGGKIEMEIFGDDMVVRLAKQDESPALRDTGFSDEQLSYLTDLELNKLRAATKVGKIDVINKYQRIILDRSKENPRTSAAPSELPVVPDEAVDSEISPTPAPQADKKTKKSK